eukprot:Skav234849  [mRNA]  locus=scaffold1355:135654:136614:+ [translate_table: standard]
MGSTSSCCSCGTPAPQDSSRLEARSCDRVQCSLFGTEEEPFLETEIELPVVPVVASTQEDAPLIRNVQGRWFLKDGKAVGDIIDSLVLWDRGGTAFLQQTGPKTLCLKVHGWTYFGEVDNVAQMSIAWDDGEHWLRK